MPDTLNGTRLSKHLKQATFEIPALTTELGMFIPSCLIHATQSDIRSSDNLGGPTIVSEFSISPADRVENNADFNYSNQKTFYSRWFAAQINTYERDTAGWVFWSWKTELGGDYRWSYKRTILLPLPRSDIIAYTMNGCIDRS